jgi:heme/copper-type cytochrome/quinol oxidase subunit 4
MSDAPPPLPGSEASMRGPWIAWIIAATLLPVLPFLLIGKRAMDNDGLMPLIFLAILCQIGCSIWLAIKMSEKLKKSSGFAFLMSVVFVIVSVIIGTASFFASCISLGALNFH